MSRNWQHLSVLGAVTILLGQTLAMQSETPAPGPEDVACAMPEASDALPPIAAADSLASDVPPVRYVLDPYPNFNGIALDPATRHLVISDTNRKSLLVYEAGGSQASDETVPLRHLLGPATSIGFVAGVAVDPVAREIYAVNNDVEDTLVAFPYGANGNAKARVLAIPHGGWGVSVDHERNEIAITVQHANMVTVYRRQASGVEPPLRSVRGPHTGLADPHGIAFDAAHGELVVSNHGAAGGREVAQAGGDLWRSTRSNGGRFLAPSITTYAATASGDAPPLRTIQGERTQLNWPMGLALDATRGEIAVANNGDNTILIFDRQAAGDAPPLRVIRGPRTRLNHPMGVAIDPARNELWVANFIDHTAVVFPRTATGDVPPLRIVRGAPADAPTGGFGNPMAVAYDSKRDQILVPN